MSNNKFLRVMSIAAASVVSLMAVAAAGFYAKYPDVPAAEELKVEASVDKLIRGAYLFENVASCVDCHSTRDWSRFAGPLKEGTRGMGGDRFGHELGLPGEFYARNITPAGIGDWTDGELKRAITMGVSRDGSPLFPIMPYLAFREMCESDLESLIAYLRELEPVENQVPPPSYDFPMNLIARTIPAAAVLPKNCPDKSDTVNYGKYLVTLGSCNDCHTQSADGKPLPGMTLAGGVTFPLPTGGTVTSRNLTPEMTTGLGDWSRERFIARFKSMASADSYPEIGKGEYNTIMPWWVYSGMTEADLGAIYDYLRTVPPVKNGVERASEQISAK